MSEIQHTPPSLRYFRANEGRWHAPFVLVITDRAALAACRLGWLDRLRVSLMERTPKLLGPFSLRTSVDATTRLADDEVVHTTRISKWGVPLYDAVEIFRLQPNGTDLAISRRERMWPSLFHARERGLSRGSVEPSGTLAHYVFPFLGVEMRQVATIEQGGVRIVQETAFSRVELLLVRS